MGLKDIHYLHFFTPPFFAGLNGEGRNINPGNIEAALLKMQDVPPGAATDVQYFSLYERRNRLFRRIKLFGKKEFLAEFGDQTIIAANDLRCSAVSFPVIV